MGKKLKKTWQRHLVATLQNTRQTRCTTQRLTTTLAPPLCKIRKKMSHIYGECNVNFLSMVIICCETESGCGGQYLALQEHLTSQPFFCSTKITKLSISRIGDLCIVLETGKNGCVQLFCLALLVTIEKVLCQQ